MHIGASAVTIVEDMNTRLDAPCCGLDINVIARLAPPVAVTVCLGCWRGSIRQVR